MKIVISAHAAAVDADSEVAVTDSERLRTLDGLDFSEERCADYFGSDLADLGIVGGLIRLAFDEDSGRLRVTTEYHAPELLTPDVMARLIEETVGQWSDGIGENGFLHRDATKLEVDLSPFESGEVRSEQFDDGIVVSKPPSYPILKALEAGDPVEALLLVTQGADLSCRDRWGNTPLHHACRGVYVDVVEAMLVSGADAGATDKEGMTPLALLAMTWVSKATEDAFVAVAKALIDHRAVVDARDTSGRTPLSWAVSRGNLALVRFLIEAGADVNAKDCVEYNEFTVVMYAKSIPIIELLLRHGADPSVPNASGEPAWEYALRNRHISGYREMSELLRSHARD